ncbi:MAG: AlpA family phage regulatory protein [Xanthomonadaceae bacterium]|nr:AlpA family phage regulatory protein [Xanthomonadaceae bacterium]
MQEAGTACREETSLLTLPQVLSRVGICRASVYNQIRAGKFPKQVKKGARSLWSSREISAWIEGSIEARDADTCQGAK